ncbi:MAG: hypothetical protein HQL07_15075 [Nitrospirae bacterium]|nr:hypothetical protein [Magnetococcales bacterium]
MEREAVMRVAVFFGVLCGVTVWEFVAPQRGCGLSRKERWLPNIVLIVWGLPPGLWV